MYDINSYKTKMQQAFVHFEDELKKIRTGRAHPAMLEGVMVSAYGAKMPLNQVATVIAAEAQLLQITPFDPSNIGAIASAIREDQTLGLNPSDDGRVVRVPIPTLTEERRRQIAKQLGEKVEECRIALRNIRHDALKDAKLKKDSKELTEDDVKRVEKQLDGFVSEFQTKLEASAKAKESEIMTV
ncbi:MAG: ribosome recycling factor [Candidatus Woesebacteria bacterium]|jgi:ribosome recycling factor